MSAQQNDGVRATLPSELDDGAVEAADVPRPATRAAELFPPAAGPRYFGTGSYEMGGSHAEGSDAVGDLNPLGGYGSFSDAGGPGSTLLYGEEQTPISHESPAQADASLSAEGARK